jgi:tetratricopeptide (TPR) repeat protein
MDGRLTMAKALIKAGNDGSATTVLAQYLRSRPNDTEALYLFGTALYKVNKDKAAEGAFRRLLSITPRDTRAIYGLAVTLDRMGRPDEARPLLELALQIDPAFERARNKLTALSSSPTAAQKSAEPTPPSAPSTPIENEEHLTAGNLLGSGHRRLSSFAGRFLQALAVISVGILVIITYEPGRLMFLARNPPFQFPSLDFLLERYETTGQPEHKQALDEAIAAIAGRSEVFDRIFLGVGYALVAIGLVLILHSFLAARLTTYEVYERRIEVTKGVLNRRRLSAWLYEIADVELRQSPMLTLTRNAEVRIYLPQTGYGKPSRFNDRSVLRIIGFGRLRDQEHLWEEIRDAALRERRIMRRWYL